MLPDGNAAVASVPVVERVCRSSITVSGFVASMQAGNVGWVLVLVDIFNC